MQTSISLAGPNPMTLIQRVWGNSMQKKVRTGIQSVMCPIRNILTVNIIDIVGQLLRATASDRLYVTFSSIGGPQYSEKTLRGTFL